MTDHDPQKFVEDISAKLASTSRHLCLFLGAGVSRACGLPDVEDLQRKVLEVLDGQDRDDFANQLRGHNLEEALGRLRRITALLQDDQTIDGLTGSRAADLDAKVCSAIIQALDISAADLIPMLKLAAWVSRARYRSPIELFTVNYDLLIETALENLRVPYFDGFAGALRARFHTELVENKPDSSDEWIPAFFARLWKIHGSVNWEWEDTPLVVRIGQPVTEGKAAAIYPSDTKYAESRRLPFVVLQDRFRRALLEPETLVIISGYSFSDQDLNELIFDAASRRERSEFLCFCFDDIPELLAERATSTPNVQAVAGGEAIIGATRSPWKQPEGVSSTIWREDKLLLPDFGYLAEFLAQSRPSAAAEDLTG